jgi:hypothetical protein
MAAPETGQTGGHPRGLGPIAPEVGGTNPLPGSAVADQTPTEEHHVE